MRLASLQESKEIDAITQSQYGISAESLMEAAGSLSAREIEQSYYPELSTGKGVAIVCGPGNNGADGLVVARHLASRGRKRGKVNIFLVAPEANRSPLFRMQLERCSKIGLLQINLIEKPISLQLLTQAALIVDAVFGIGMSRPIEEPYARVIDEMNKKSSPPIVSLDTPSGLDCDRGFPFGAKPNSDTRNFPTVKANMTITFGLAKPGFFIAEGPKYVGRLRVISIGIPIGVIQSEANTLIGFGENQALRSLPRQVSTSNKANHGHALLFAGSSGMYGAAILAASSAYRMGAGYVTLASHEEALEVLQKIPEILTTSADDEKLWSHRKWTSAGIGPGLGANKKTRDLLEKLISAAHSRVVVDADAITVLAQMPSTRLPSNWIVTPHSGELARVLDVTSDEINSDRIHYAREGARKLGCHVLLKGFRTVVVDSSGERVAVILSGNSALAKAGTGDVLTGMIVGLLAQDVLPFRAAAAAAYIHGRIADEWVRAGNAARAFEASDLREILPSLMGRLKTVGSKL